MINPVGNPVDIKYVQYPTPQYMPKKQYNYIKFDENKTDMFVRQGEKALPYLEEIVKYSQNEAQLTETLYILNRMLDNGTKGIDKMYPSLSRLNSSKSPYLQTFLAGIYRKTQVPDAFGVLLNFLIQNSLSKSATVPFDPNEEIGGAILSYLSK